MSYFGKISARERYALRLTIWLAHTFKSRGIITLKEISRREMISLKYLEQLIAPLKKAGWVKSRRGSGGGYTMIKNPGTVTLKNLIDIISDQHKLVDCLDNPSACPLAKACPSKTAWKKVQTALDNTLQKIKLSQLIKP